jgi:hypothetical protein
MAAVQGANLVRAIEAKLPYGVERVYLAQPAQRRAAASLGAARGEEAAKRMETHLELVVVVVRAGRVEENLEVVVMEHHRVSL